MDLGPSEPLALPILTPLFGFSSCTAPEIQGDVLEINEGNWYFTRKVLRRASASSITLQRGTRFFDSDFWRWMLAAVTGDTGGFQLGIPLLRVGGPTYRRDLLLLQYFPKSSLGGIFGISSDLAGGAINVLAAASAGGIAGQGAVSIANLAAFQTVFGLAQGFIGVDAKIGPFDFAARIPAKMWLLHDVIPTRLKVTGDFDATSGAVGLAELDLAVEYFEEIGLAA